MHTYTNQIELLNDAREHLSRAYQAYKSAKLLWEDNEPSSRETPYKADFVALECFAKHCLTTTQTLDGLKATLKGRFEKELILQATITYGDLRRKIYVNKPNDRLDEPWILETTYETLRKVFKADPDRELATTEDYPILVVRGNSKEVIAVIRK